MFQNRLFVAFTSRCGFGAAVSEAVARSSIGFCNSVAADRIVVAPSRLLGAAAACVILLSQKRWSVGCEECSVKCGAWRVQWALWSVKFGVWSVKCGMWSVKFGVRRVQCEVWSVKCEVWSLKSTVWSEVLTAKSAVWSVKTVKCEDCQVWSVTWSFKCDMWNKTPVSQSVRTYGLRWRTAHASSIDEKGLIYIFKVTSAPPRAGTTGI